MKKNECTITELHENIRKLVTEKKRKFEYGGEKRKYIKEMDLKESDIFYTKRHDQNFNDVFLYFLCSDGVCYVKMNCYPPIGHYLSEDVLLKKMDKEEIDSIGESYQKAKTEMESLGDILDASGLRGLFEKMKRI